MKKAISLLLAIAMVFGVATVSFGASNRIKSMDKAIDSNFSYDYSEISAGLVVKYPLTADMFTWTDGTTGIPGTPVTKAQANAVSLKPVLSGSQGTDLIKDTTIVYEKSEVVGGLVTAQLKVTFVDSLPSTSSKRISANLFVSIGTRQQKSRIDIKGVMENTTVYAEAGDTIVNIDKGQMLEAKAFIRNLEIYIGGGITVISNVYSGQKYYGSASATFKPEDDKVLRKYDSIDRIIYVETVGLNKSGNTVMIDSYTGYYIYNSKGDYIGRGQDKLPYSVKYYISSKSLGESIDTSGSGNGNGNGNSSSSSSSSSESESSGGGSSVSGTIAKDKAVKDTKAAITKANNAGSKIALVTYKNTTGITAEALKAMASTGSNAGKTIQVNADTSTGNSVTGRLTMNAAAASKLTEDTKFGVYVDSKSISNVKGKFDKWFTNKKAYISLGQKATYNMNVNVAAKVNMSGINTKNIRLYSYNSSTNKYNEITNSGVWVDSNGYIRFTTKLAGDIIISDGPLKKG